MNAEAECDATAALVIIEGSIPACENPYLRLHLSIEFSRRAVDHVFPTRNNRSLFRAFRACDIAVEFDDVAAPGALMQSIHILRDELEAQKEVLHYIHLRDANTGAGQGFTDLAAAVQLRLRVASGLQTFTVKSRLLTGENAVQFRGNPPFRMEN
jgi:hypothetical protein